MTIDLRDGAPAISVLMPTYGHARFIPAAIASLLAQERADWELIVVDDGSPDDTAAVVAPYLADPRIGYERLAHNVGLGAALNVALARARAPRIAYLPSDDRYWPDHLGSLAARLDAAPAAALAYSGSDITTIAAPTGSRRAFVAVGAGDAPTQRGALAGAHRAGDRRPRPHAVGPPARGGPGGRDRARHLRMGGPPRAIAQAAARAAGRPQRLSPAVRGDAPAAVSQQRRQPDRRGRALPPRARAAADPRARDGLTILLVGELAYNADRVLALEERGHSLYGLWMEGPHWYNTVGPLPFGHVRDLPRDDWQRMIRALRPDVIYALLNWQAVPFAREVLAANTGVPFVWHFKEGPFICREKGTWPALMDLHTRADGLVYSSPEMREWFATVLPASAASIPSRIVDGDLPRREWFAGEPSPRLSQADGSIHTVVPGRPIGLHPHHVAELAAEDVHLHFYGDFTHGQWREWIDRARALAPRHLHLHGHVDQRRWLAEFSRYDAGWLHFFASGNDGDIARADWDDLNIPPARRRWRPPACR
ncbi:glycosyltransferase [Nannocystis pusilla]|uniref:glycosyltransferase n=1 Tax=Nannocystis pusilla TaxID=889268 RepID=UPI003B75E0BE